VDPFDLRARDQARTSQEARRGTVTKKQRNTSTDRPDLAAALLPLLGAIARLRGRPHVVRKHRADMLLAVSKLIDALQVDEPDPSQRSLIAIARSGKGTSGKGTWHDILASALWANWEGHPEAARRAARRRAESDRQFAEAAAAIAVRYGIEVAPLAANDPAAAVKRKPMRRARQAAHRSGARTNIRRAAVAVGGR
jgi:hypothetical protein